MISNFTLNINYLKMFNKVSGEAVVYLFTFFCKSQLKSWTWRVAFAQLVEWTIKFWSPTLHPLQTSCQYVLHQLLNVGRKIKYCIFVLCVWERKKREKPLSLFHQPFYADKHNTYPKVTSHVHQIFLSFTYQLSGKLIRGARRKC